MSYDFTLFELEKGLDLDTALSQREEHNEVLTTYGNALASFQKFMGHFADQE
jgi:hypothetical protein